MKAARYASKLKPFVIAAGLGLGALPLSANAVLQIAFSINGGPSTVVCDNCAGDIDPTVGVLQLANFQPIAGLSVTGSTQTSQKGDLNILTTGSTSIINNSGAPVTALVTVSDTNFIGPIQEAIFSGSGTWTNAIGSTINLSWYDDPANQQGADFAGDTPGILLGTFLNTATLLSQSFSTNQTVPVSDPALFSMTEQFQFTLVNGGQLTSRGQSEVKIRVLSEPGVLGLLGVVLGVVGWSTRKRPA
ncbi:MAG: hypothetical protein ACM3SS_15495 [Rhodospirillaceae bacterium]